MKSIMKVGILAILVIAALAFTGYAFANSNGVGIQDMLSGNYAMRMNGSSPGGVPAMHGNGGGLLKEYMDEAWAKVLGLTVEELEELRLSGLSHYQIALDQGKTAEETVDLMTAAMTLAVASAVQDGVITSEQGQLMLQHMNEKAAGGMFGRMDGFGGFGRHFGFGRLAPQGDLLEEFLGMTKAEIQERVQNGESLEEILTAGGKTVEEWAEYSFQAKTNQINEAVSNGDLTQEQADLMLQQLQDKFESGWFESFGPGVFHGAPGFHGKGGMMDGPGWGRSGGMHGRDGHPGPWNQAPALDNGATDG